METTKRGNGTSERGKTKTGAGKGLVPQVKTYIKQPNTLTFANYDFSPVQIKGLVVVIEHLQEQINELIYSKINPVQLSIFDDNFEKEFQIVAEDKKPAIVKESFIQFKILLKDFGIAPNRYDDLKKSLLKIQSMPIELKVKDEASNKEFTRITSLFETLIEEPVTFFDEKKQKEITTRVNHVYINIRRSVALSLLTLDSGFTKYMKEIVMSQSSKYAIRIYMFLSSFKRQGFVRITYARFADMLGIQEGQYDESYSDFKKRVIQPAYDALFENADFWFKMKEEYRNKSQKYPSHLFFSIITNHENQIDEAFATRLTSFKSMLKIHFDMDDKMIENLVPYLNSENIKTSLMNLLVTLIFAKPYLQESHNLTCKKLTAENNKKESE